MNRLRCFVVDAFTNRPFAGNPAAVVSLAEWRDDAWLQSVAMEMNLSETAFLVEMCSNSNAEWANSFCFGMRMACC
jgi:PhzF family phenazine biosynthesis protein